MILITRHHFMSKVSHHEYEFTKDIIFNTELGLVPIRCNGYTFKLESYDIDDNCAIYESHLINIDGSLQIGSSNNYSRYEKESFMSSPLVLGLIDNGWELNFTEVTH